MGASLALAQRAREPEQPAATAQPTARQPAVPGRQPAAVREEAPPRAPDRAPDGTRPDADRRAPQARDRDIAPADAARNEGDERQPRELGIKFQGAGELLIGEVAQGSAAADAGLRAQDRIISVNGRPITGQRRFEAFLSGLGGRRVPIVIEREGRQLTVQLATSEASGEGPWLGVFLQDNQEGEQGARVTHVYPAGPAARAGLRSGDVILQVNDQKVAGAPELIGAIDGMKPQDKVALQVLRGDQQVEVTATLASRDAFVFHRRGGGGEFQGGEFARGEFSDDNDPLGNLPPYAMQLEHDRRMAEQHQRLEEEMRKLLEEVRLLRQAIERR
jgi:predicted metalloprotease with PDZ domain